jgi:hypothetical protein
VWTFDGHEIFEPLWTLVQSTQMTPEEYWPLIRDTWERSEVIAPNLKQWMDLLAGDCPRRELIMTEEERATLDSQPDEFVIYRGCFSPHGQDGISWTLSRDTAIAFAEFADAPRPQFFPNAPTKVRPTVIQAMCKKRDVIAYLNGRNEHEILILPSSLSALS